MSCMSRWKSPLGSGNAPRQDGILAPAGLASGMAAGVFALDLWLPSGVAVPMGYTALVLAALWSPHRGFTLALAFTGILLTILGYVLSPAGPDAATALLNRGLALGVIAVSAALVAQRQRAREEIRTLQRFLPMCASCRKIRDDQGYWSGLEQYVETHAKVLFSHCLCPSCMQKWYPDFSPEPLAHNPGPEQERRP